MSHIDIDFGFERREHPLDIVEKLAALNEWSFERDADEISVAVSGAWADYEVAFTWLADLEALHLACAFDLKVPQPRAVEVTRLVALANERLWVGHFDLWSSEGVVMFRHALLLAGGAMPNGQQAQTLVKLAVETCDKHFQAFHFVVWAGKNAREALDAAFLETVGEA